MPQEINQQLLQLYWSGGATPIQQKLIEEWLIEPAHQELYYRWLVSWEEQYPQSMINPDQAWEKFNQRLDTPAAPSLQPNASVVSVSWLKSSIWRIAATVLLVLASTFWLWPFVNQEQYRTTAGQTQRVLLPDSSWVLLQPNSELMVSRFFFNWGERTVRLKGEANFSVRHQPDSRRFIVKTDKSIEVVVLGTEFVVAARPRQFQVVLHTGKVLLRSLNRQMHPLTLQPGDIFTFSGKGHPKLARHQPTNDLMIGQHHLFVFDHNTVSEVLEMIQEQFGERIRVADSSQISYKITGRFRAKNTDELLTVLTGLTGYHVDRQGNKKVLVR